MKNASHHQNALGVIGLLIVSIGFVLFYKLVINQEAFADDIVSLRNYSVLSILTMGFLVGLFFLASKPHATKSAAKPTKKKKKSR